MNIQWTEPAVLDLKSISDYIARDSEYYAAEFIGRILDAVDNLFVFPSMGRIVPEIDDHKIREIIFHGYRIIYKTCDEKEIVLILAVIHAARDINIIQPSPFEIV